MAGLPTEPWGGQPDPAGDIAAKLRDRIRATVGAGADLIVAPGEAIAEPKTADNRIMLLTGDHGGARFVKDGTFCQGTPGSRLVRQVVVEHNAEFQDVDFVSLDGGNTAQAFLVDIRNIAATVFFRNCRFIKATRHSTQFVQIANGARVLFIGCQFLPPGMGAGSVIAHAGAAANVGLIGVSNRTGQAFPATVTAVFVTT